MRNQLFFGRKRRALTEGAFDKGVQELVKNIQQAVSPFENDTPKKKEARIRKASLDPAFFYETYLPHYFSAPPAECHAEWEAQIDAGQEQHRPVAIAAPREHAKSTVISFARSVRLAALGRKKFFVKISDTEIQARAITASIKAEFEHNPRLIHDFGVQKTERWADDDFVLTNGTAFLARGRGQKVRGLKHGAHRPDDINLDDYDDEQLAKNPHLEAFAFKRIKGTFFPALDSDTGVLYIVGNIFSHHCILQMCVEDEAFLSRVYPAIAHPTWSHERRAFTGGVPLWPEKFSLEKLSGIRFVIGSAEFNAEYQHEPEDGSTLFPREYIQRVHPSILETLPVLYFAAIDPSLKHHQTADFKAIVTIGASGKHLYVRHAWIKRKPISAMTKAAYMIDRLFHPQVTGLEEEGWQTLLRAEFEREGLSQKYQLRLMPIRQHGLSKDSVARIGGLASLVEFGTLLFVEGLEREVGDMELLIDQFVSFPSSSVNDDGPDACEMAVRISEGAAGRKPEYESVQHYNAHFSQDYAAEGLFGGGLGRGAW